MSNECIVCLSGRHPLELWRSSGVRQVFIVVEDASMSAKNVGLMVSWGGRHFLVHYKAVHKCFLQDCLLCK